MVWCLHLRWKYEKRDLSLYSPLLSVYWNREKNMVWNLCVGIGISPMFLVLEPTNIGRVFSVVSDFGIINRLVLGSAIHISIKRYFKHGGRCQLSITQAASQFPCGRLWYKSPHVSRCEDFQTKFGGTHWWVNSGEHSVSTYTSLPPLL